MNWIHQKYVTVHHAQNKETNSNNTIFNDLKQGATQEHIWNDI